MGSRWAVFKTVLAALIVVLVVISLIMGISFNVWGIFITAYGLVVIPRTILQIIFSVWNNFRNEELSRWHIANLLKRKGYALPRNGKWMRYPEWRSSLFQINPGLQDQWNTLVQQSMPRPHKIGVEVPVYGLSPEELRDTVVSILNQSVPIEIVIIGLNQPTNLELIKAAYQMHSDIQDPRVVVIEMPEPGKRGAMNAGFTMIAEAGCDITVNVDGDTVLDQDAIYTALMLIDAQIGIEGVTSNVNVRNRDMNLLTLLTFMRYRYANEQERAAQSLFAGVTCMSGPLMVTLTTHVQDIAPEWAFETFMGVPIGPGDDRSLTMHHLRRGWGVGYSPASVVWTDCPSEIPAWKRQQLRWSRSGKREFVRGWKWMYRMPMWSVLDQMYLMVFPFIFGAILGSIAAQFLRDLVFYGLTTAFYGVIDYIIIIFVVNFITATIAVIRNRDWRSYINMGQIYMHIRYLLRIHIHALFTLPESAWLTRGGDKK